MAGSIRDDDELLAACAEGDEQALSSLYDRFGKIAYALALRVLRDAALAEDAVQEAFLAVWRQAAAFDRSRGTASTWILTLVHRRAVDLVRSQVRFNGFPDQLEVMAPQHALAESIDDDVVLRETRGEVQAALATLSRAEREVLGLAYWCGLTQSEIAAVLDIPCGTVKSRTFSALARLREALSEVPELTASTRGDQARPGPPALPRRNAEPPQLPAGARPHPDDADNDLASALPRKKQGHNYHEKSRDRAVEDGSSDCVVDSGTARPAVDESVRVSVVRANRENREQPEAGHDRQGCGGSDEKMTMTSRNHETRDDSDDDEQAYDRYQRQICLVEPEHRRSAIS
jgi:RNA polymerase sigma factor (sigma-70 family)